jgi:TolB-like protein
VLYLINELKRRNVLRVAAAYVVSAWLLIQVAETSFPLFGFGDTPARLVVIGLAIGFIPAIVFAWAFELTPEGLKKEKDVDRSLSTTPQTGKKLDRIIMLVLALALGYFAFDKFVLSESREASIAESARQQGRNEALVESFGDNSIAVLPFVNMSSDAEQDFFSDGLSEELLNLLAKIPELRVTSRSSAFAFKGEKIDIPIVAKKLKVAHILEGSVRKFGNQVRITAQLIEAGSDMHLWSETYDRSLDNIFAIQDEIASEVVAQLKITLLGEKPRTQETNPEAYALYLQGRHLHRLRTEESLEQAQILLKKALALDPYYAAAWDELGYSYINQVNLALRPVDEGYTMAREAINKALAVDPECALAHASLGFIARAYDNDPAAGALHLQRALQLDPANISIISSGASLSASLGRLDEAIVLSEYVVARDPVSPRSNVNLGGFYNVSGQWDKAIASFNTALTLNPDYNVVHYKIGTAYLFKGDPQAALEAMQQEETVWGMVGLAMAYHALGQESESDALVAQLIEQHEQGWAYNIAYLFAFRGEADRAFEWLGKAVEYKDGGLSEIQRENLFSNIREDPRWLPFLESIGKSPGQLAAIVFKVTLLE